MKEDTEFRFYHYIELDEILKRGTDRGIENIVGYGSFLLLMYLKDGFMNIGVSVLPIAIAFVVYRFIIRLLTLYTNIKIYYPKIEGENLFYKFYGCIFKITKCMTFFFLISVGIAIYKEGINYVLENIYISKIYINVAFILLTFYICRVHLFKKYITGKEYCELAKKVRSNISFEISKIELNKRIMQLKNNGSRLNEEPIGYVNITKKKDIKEHKGEVKKINVDTRRKARDINIDIEID